MDNYFSVSIDELVESLRYHGEATFCINGSRATYNNPNLPELMIGVTGEMSLWQFDDGRKTVVFNTVSDALNFILPDGRTIASAIATFQFEDFV